MNVSPLINDQIADLAAPHFPAIFIDDFWFESLHNFADGVTASSACELRANE